MKPILLHSGAKADLKEACKYYDNAREGLAAEFLDELENSWEAIKTIPQGFPKFEGSDYRQFPLKRFPYRILYRETDEDIRVIAVAHVKRRPGYWKSREFPTD